MRSTGAAVPWGLRRAGWAAQPTSALAAQALRRDGAGRGGGGGARPAARDARRVALGDECCRRVLVLEGCQAGLVQAQRGSHRAVGQRQEAGVCHLHSRSL